MTTMLKTRPLIAGLAVAAALLAGCHVEANVGEKTVDKDKLASLAREKLEEAAGQKSDGVECDGGVPAKVDATQQCVLTALDGTKIGVTATVTAVNGDDVSLDFEADDHPQE